ncbi:U3 small nucleolar RNA-associated protein 14 homolog A [Narcine bancroftii]|uniref:U3 small nucleolar RNA-associated protein 14 homolog A n=1 Tax=Narcine bancroftii TaxID=1343680 RepID=UPI0038320D76
MFNETPFHHHPPGVLLPSLERLSSLYTLSPAAEPPTQRWRPPPPPPAAPCALPARRSVLRQCQGRAPLDGSGSRHGPTCCGCKMAATAVQAAKTSTRDLLFLGVEEEDLFKTEHHLTASEDEDGSDDERKHQKLLEAISSLSDKKRKKTERTEASLQVSEFTVNSEGTDEKIDISDLVGSIRSSSPSLKIVKKQLTKFEKTNKPLDLPLNKLQSEKIQRILAYEKTGKEITKWDPIVRKNRKAEQLTFPLNEEPLAVKPMEEVIKGWKAQTPLEEEVFNLLHKNKQPVMMPVVTPRERASLRAMCLEEAKERRAELQKARALQSYYEARTKRAKKIKSKKYHKIMKKVKHRDILKKFDELRKTNPEAALEELNKMEQMRMEERMSLRHQNSGKWAKSKVIMAKYDTEARNAIQQQLEKNKLLTKKVVPPSESEDEAEADKDEIVPDFVNDVQINTAANPWMLGKLSTNPKNVEPEKVGTVVAEKLDGSEESDEGEKLSEDEMLLQEFEERRRIRKEREGVQSVKVDETKRVNNNNENVEKKSTVPIGQEEKEEHLEDDVCEFNRLFQTLVKNKPEPLQSRSKKILKKNKKVKTEQKEDIQIQEEKDEPILNERLERKKTIEELEALGWDEGHELDEASALNTPRISDSVVDSESKSDTKTEVKSDHIINPKNVLMLASKTIEVPLVPTAIEDENDDQEDQRMIIKEAFASDDVINDFKKEKKRQINESKPKGIDLTLPGWGEWGGQGLRPSAKKRRRFYIKPPPALPRKDQNLPNVIINEKRDVEIAAHQVNELPFPFANRNQFEKSICAPLGKTWNTEKAIQKLHLPNIVTKLGAIIQPISGEDVFQDKKKSLKTNEEQNPHRSRKRWHKNSSHRRS